MQSEFISLREATKFCPEAEADLRARVEQGKLRAVVAHDELLTTKDWVKKYVSEEYISLQEAAIFSSYSQEYLSLRARQGKLRAVKIGRNWQGFHSRIVPYPIWL